MKSRFYTKAKMSRFAKGIGAGIGIAAMAVVVNSTPSLAKESSDSTDIGTLGYSASARAMNDNGAVVGQSYKTLHEYHAFLWQNGNMTDLGTTGENSQAYAVNNNNQVVGVRYLDNNQQHAFLWQNGVLQDLTPILGLALAYDINNEGKIVGNRFTENGHSAFLLDSTTGEVTTLGQGIAFGINDHNQIVGMQVIGGYYQATLWQPNGEAVHLGALPGYVSSLARDINDNGEIVGWSADEYGWEQDAFYWKEDTMQAIGPNDGNNDVFNINNSGQVIGTNEVGDHIPSAFLWHMGQLDDISITDKYTYGVDINNSGQFVVNTSDGHAYITSAETTPKSIQEIIAATWLLFDNGELNYADTRLLTTLLEKAEAKIEKQPAACRILAMTIEEITQMKQDERLSASVADKLISDIQKVSQSIGC